MKKCLIEWWDWRLRLSDKIDGGTEGGDGGPYLHPSLYITVSNLCLHVFFLRFCLYISISTILSLHLCADVSVFMSLSLRLRYSDSVSTSLSLRHCLYFSICMSFFMSLPLHLSFSLNVSVSAYLSLRLCFYFPVSYIYRFILLKKIIVH